MWWEFQCCGVASHEDWKYIPTSCCNGVTKSEKLACINHFIQKSQAYERGCNRELDDYFATKFFFHTFLLLLAIIVLLFLLVLWLLEIY